MTIAYMKGERASAETPPSSSQTDGPRLVTATTPLTAGRITRDPRLDFFRGLAMFIILVAHTPRNMLALWIPARFGFSDATEIFVFCSGMASAIAFGRTFDRKGFWLGTARVVFRVWQVYWAHIGLFFAIAGMMAAIDLSEVFTKSYIGSLNLWPFFDDPPRQLVGLMTLTYVPNYFDILPMYLVILAMLPIVMFLSRVHLLAVAACCLVLWTLSQQGVMDLVGLGAYALDLPAEPWTARSWFFNPFGWQLIFFTGFAFMRGWIPAPPVKGVLIALAGAVVLANVVVSDFGMRAFGWDWIRSWRSDHVAWFFKTDFGVLRFVQFLSLAYLGWAAAGPDGARLRARGRGLLARIWAPILAVIMKVGQQSLAIFVVSMVTARLIGIGFDVYGRDVATVLIGNAIGFVILGAVAYLVGWFKGHPWRQKGGNDAKA